MRGTWSSIVGAEASPGKGADEVTFGTEGEGETGEGLDEREISSVDVDGVEELLGGKRRSRDRSVEREDDVLEDVLVDRSTDDKGSRSGIVNRHKERRRNGALNVNGSGRQTTSEFDGGGGRKARHGDMVDLLSAVDLEDLRDGELGSSREGALAQDLGKTNDCTLFEEEKEEEEEGQELCERERKRDGVKTNGAQGR